MTDETQRQRVQLFLTGIGFKADGTPPKEIRVNDLRSTVAGNPDGAANFVMQVAGMENPPSVYRQLAFSIAVAYRAETGDDTLEELWKSSPWESETNPPKLVEPDGTPLRTEVADDNAFASSDNAVRGLEVPRSDADAGEISPFVARFSLDGKAARQIEEMAATWGSWVISFPYEDDDRPAILIPAIRRYIARVQEAIPYFPAYLDFTPELGMFWLYFGALADRDALHGNQLDIGHASILTAVIQSGHAIRNAAARTHRAHEPLWRAMLSNYPHDVIEDLMERFQKTQ